MQKIRLEMKYDKSHFLTKGMKLLLNHNFKKV